MKKKAPMVKKTTIEQDRQLLRLKDYLALEQFTDTGYKL